ncbi:SMI1/KNR4 family protein [Georgenia phoenicis]|uniref:SMI1/KNR4 family protein n=1 Tax=unclassified Georgenia TaxID=2626815 RepID=UPI0039B09005
MTTPPLPRLLDAWRLAGAHVDLAPPATAAELARAEADLGHPFPAEVRELYAACNGMSLASGDLVLHPLIGPNGRGVTTAAPQLREQSWRVPEELLVLGDNGGDEAIGVWTVPDARRTLVVLIGSPLDDSPLALLGTSLTGCLAAWTAYFLPLADPGEDPAVADFLAELDAPRPEAGEEDEHLMTLLAWGSPDLPELDDVPLTPEELTRLAQQA